MKKYAADRLMNVVLAPVVSEKSTFVADKNRQYVFRVADGATKPEFKAAIELMFKTKVDSVTVSNVKGKERRFVYVRIGQLAGQHGSEWRRRMKIDIHDTPQPLLDRAMEGGGVLEFRIDGTAEDGTPACATVKPVNKSIVP